jgi:hypothetical protein
VRASARADEPGGIGAIDGHDVEIAECIISQLASAVVPRNGGGIDVAVVPGRDVSPDSLEGGDEQSSGLAEAERAAEKSADDDAGRTFGERS